MNNFYKRNFIRNDKKELPLMLGMINAIVNDKKLELDWESFR